MARQSWYSGTRLDPALVAHYAFQAGFRGDDLARMVAIAGRESGYDPGAHGSSSPRERLLGDRGLWQINSINDQYLMGQGLYGQRSDLFDPQTNANAAYALFRQGGYSPWTAGPGGWTQGGDPMYGTDYGAAKAAVDRYLADPTSIASGAGSTGPAAPPEYQGPEASEEGEGGEEGEPVDPEQQAALTSMLGRFGVQYPDAPRPTPALLAFMNGLGMALDTAEDIQRTTAQRVTDRAIEATQDLARRDQRRRRNITTDLQRRGVLRSGEANTRYARQAEDTADRQGDIARIRAEGIADSDALLRQVGDQYRQQALDRVIASEQDLATQAATEKAQADALKAQEEAERRAFENQKELNQWFLREQERIMRGTSF